MRSEKTIYYAIFVLFGLGLLSYLHPQHIHPLRTYYHDILIFLGLIAALLVMAVRQSVRLYFPAVLLLPTAILGLIALQATVGIVSLVGAELILPIAYLLLCAAAMILGASLLAYPLAAQLLCVGLAIMHLFAALLSLVMQQLQLAGVDATPFVMYMAPGAQLRPFANVAQPNQLALLFCLALGSLWYLYQTMRLPEKISILLTLCLLWGLVLTQSRIGWLIIPLFAVLAGQTKAGGRSINRTVLGGLLLLYIALVLGLPQLGQWLGFSSASVAAHVGGRSERLVLLQQAWQMAAEHPWLGVGWFGFGAEQVRIAADFSSTTYAEHSHNLLLNFAAELGWPATISIFSGLIWWLWQCCINVKASMPVRFAIFCLIAVGVHSMVEFPLWYAYVLMPVGLLMGMLHQLRWPAAGRVVPRAAIVVPSVAALFAMVLLTADYQRVVNGFNILRTGKTYTEADKRALTRPEFTLFGEYFLYFDVMGATAHEGMSAGEIAAVEHMSGRFGFVHILNKLAEVYALNGQPQKAERTMVTLQRLHPYSYPEYFDYWKSQAELDQRYAAVFIAMPKRDAD
jgi:O-antigen ligase